MGPTNVALVKLYQADQELRNAQAALDAATRNVRVQTKRVDAITRELEQAQDDYKHTQAQIGEMESDVAARSEHIDKLRSQQQNVSTNREYQALLVEISTQKIDRGKVEDELVGKMEAAEQQKAEVDRLEASLEQEQLKLDTMRQEIGGKVAELEAEIKRLEPIRAAAAEPVPASVLATFDRLAERYDGEAMAAIEKPDPRREEYICNACNMDLVADSYNRLHARDEPMLCPSCRRLMFIPADLPPEAAVKQKKVTRKKASADAE